ncbi:MAG: hypothetical protein JWP91_117 [Fibrobacteres bacterium]|nr:hypothetical protein [Fibrobacterota bacterium]
MKYIKRLLLLAFIILLGVFAWRNQTYLGSPVVLVFFRRPMTLVLGFWLVLSFLLGLLVYMIIDLPRDIAMKSDLRRKSKEIARLQFELNRHLNASAGNPPPPNPDLEKRLGL